MTTAVTPDFVMTTMPRPFELLVTLWPDHEHFPAVAADPRVCGIRLNSAMISRDQLLRDLNSTVFRTIPDDKQLFFDIKGRQLRVEEVFPSSTHLELRLNHPIEVDCPVPVYFKAGADRGTLRRLEEDGRRLIFEPGNPYWNVKEGESIHILDPSFRPIPGPQFSDLELQKIEIVRAAGLRRFFLSYVESAADVGAFRELVGEDAEIWLKIESVRGLHYVRSAFRKVPNLYLVAARGDLYLELPRPQHLVSALKLIIEKDPEACLGSRLMLSVVRDPIPSAPDFSTPDWSVDAGICSDIMDLAWLHDLGYRRFMLCDEICLNPDWLNTAIGVVDGFRRSMTPKPSPVP